MNDRCDLNLIKQKAAEIVFESAKHLTQQDIEKELANRHFYPKKQIKQAIKALIAEQTLVYTYKYGHSFLEKSFNRPVRISKHVVLKPPGIQYARMPDDVVIEVQRGASFGLGDHPTTRLAVKGIEHILYTERFFTGKKNTVALDIGTGSGVLAMTAVLFGVDKAIGIDVDQIARKEAKENIIINGLDNRIQVNDWPLDNIGGRFSLITANLRYPTLARLYSRLNHITEDQAAVVISGLKTSEMSDIKKLYTKKFFKLEKSEVEKGWGAMVFTRKAGMPTSCTHFVSAST
ncbi:MAG: 50S ribosomal protein L11 methyltransferase [Thermodesulfobacteriota bacterium]|nr:50S ribosomal protein L11 methyltransferase [Thermodesulfobacteriota bacterium]